MFTTAIVLALSVLMVAGPVYAEEGFRFSPRPNRAHLIKWRHWSREVFEEAKRTGKPILLSISAVWCHWCHVMDETTYSDQRIIDYINEHFIPVRVDADRRPDIDSLYNQGGWPSTVFLTEEGEIIVGDTYIPPQRMLPVLQEIYDLYTNRKDELKRELEKIKNRKALIEREKTRGAPDSETIDHIERLLQRFFDPVYGGFGESQKFPNPWAIEFLLTGAFEGKDWPTKIVEKTLQAMMEGEIYDPVEGGFFRYSTRRDWSAPHYEKMLQLNAELIINYAHAYMVLKREDFLSAAIKTDRYLKNTLYDRKTGLYCHSQDADEEYYKQTNRKGLKPPFVDRTFFSDSNASVLRGLVALYRATSDRDYLKRAEALGESILKKLYNPASGVYHYYLEGKGHLPGLLRDNTEVALALHDLYMVTGKKEYLQRAIEIGDFILKNFFDGQKLKSTLQTEGVNPVTGGFMRRYANAQDSFSTLLLFGILMHYEERFKQPWQKVSGEFAQTVEEYIIYSGTYGLAIAWGLEPVMELQLVSASPERFLSVINRVYLPRAILKIYNPEDSKSMKALGYPPEEALYICSNGRCLRPVKQPELSPATLQEAWKKIAKR